MLFIFKPSAVTRATEVKAGQAAWGAQVEMAAAAQSTVVVGTREGRVK